MIRSQHQNRKPFAPNSLKIPTRQHRCNKATAYVLLFIGPLMLLPCAALNEWGSTVWIMEELAVAPLHWGFVFFGWFFLSMFGVSLLIIGRIRELSSGHEDVLGVAPSE
jgi:methane/ammonia monooxygenase subunit C